jgi:hypothetical protein
MPTHLLTVRQINHPDSATVSKDDGLVSRLSELKSSEF